MYIMADKLSDEELVEQLAKYGEKIKQPLTENRRSILRKKLNHLLAKNRRRSALSPARPHQQQSRTSTTSNRNNNELSLLSGFSSDDTDDSSSEYNSIITSSTSYTTPSIPVASVPRATRMSAAGYNNSSSPKSPSSQNYPPLQHHQQSDRRRSSSNHHKTDTRHHPPSSKPSSSSPISANIPNNTSAYSGWHNASPPLMMHSPNNPPAPPGAILKSAIKSSNSSTASSATTTKKYGYNVTIPYGTPPAPSSPDGAIRNSGYNNHHQQQPQGQQHTTHHHHHIHSPQHHQHQALHHPSHPPPRVRPSSHHTTTPGGGRGSSSRAVAAAVAAAAAAQKKSSRGTTTVFESSDSDIGLEDDDEEDDDDDEDEEEDDDDDDINVLKTSSSSSSPPSSNLSPLKKNMSSSALPSSSSAFHNSDNRGAGPNNYSPPSPSSGAGTATTNTVNRVPTSKILKEFRQNYTKTRKNPYKPGTNSWDPYVLCGIEGPFRERNSHCISWVLPVVAALFFLILGIMYVRNWNNNGGGGALPENNEAFVRIQALCNNTANNTVFADCKNSDIDTALRLLKMIYEDLSDRHGKVECGHTTNEKIKTISMLDLRQQIAKHLNEDDRDRFEKMMVWLVTDSEDWGIRPITADGDNATIADEVKYLESYIPNMNFLCRLRRAVVRMVYQLILAFLGFIFMILLFRFYLIKRKNTEEEQRQVYEMVEKIIDILKTHCEAMARQEDDAHLAVQHVRDQLLPPAQRKQLLSTWEKAAKFIEDNESRIRLETRTIEGEEFQVWRWLPIPQNLNNGGKIWQGQAFGEHDDAGTPPYSPTPCLKVRNMFEVDMEEGENWHINIEDAILEKCKNINGILHIYVDKSSREGCVYIKCDTCVTAGQVHRALHGWWFDRRLVTVKYLRLEYYHERFPDSRVMITPMHPSTGSRMHSLSQPFHKSTLEMT